MVTSRSKASSPGLGVNHTNLTNVQINNSPPLQAALINARSVCNKPIPIHDYVVENCLDILAISETWLKAADNVTIAALSPPGYSFYHVPRSSRSGGVGLLCRDTIKVKHERTKSYESFENMLLTLTVRSTVFRILVIYRPPPSQTNRLTFSQFKEEFPCMLEDVLLLSGELLILGDFSIHMETPGQSETASFISMIESAGLEQQVRSLTRATGILDILLTRSDHLPIDISVKDILLSDHYAVEFSLDTAKPPLPTKEITYRSMKAIDIEAFSYDIEHSELLELDTDDVDELADMYNTVLTETLDKHAPLKKKVVTIHPKAPWYNGDIDLARKEKRKA